MHWRRPIEMLATSWMGRGQLLFLSLLWAMVIGNFTKALPAFSAGRIVTEGVIYLNAVVVTVLILVFPSRERLIEFLPATNVRRLAIVSLVAFVVTFAAVPTAEWWSTRRVYGDAHSGKRGMDFRFGPNTNWKRAPLLKDQLHR